MPTPNSGQLQEHAERIRAELAELRRQITQVSAEVADLTAKLGRNAETAPDHGPMPAGPARWQARAP
jgi:hypothetical protein